MTTMYYNVYKKTELWSLNDLQAIVLIWQLWMLRINDPQLYTWALYDVVIDLQCIQDL